MVQVVSPLGIWVQLASFCFTLAGLHGDLLVIRFFLFLAYMMLFLNSILGSPLWPDAQNPGSLAVDSIVWSSCGLYVHGVSMIRLILDERPVKLSSALEALWRMFYRTGGLSMKLFQQVVAPNVELVEVEIGCEIPTSDFFYIIFSGLVSLKAYGRNGDLKVERTLGSAEMFDVAHLDMFPSESAFLRTTIHCQARARTTLFRFSKIDLAKISHHQFDKDVWQALLINNLSIIVDSQRSGRSLLDCGCNRIFAPLEEWEQPQLTASGSGRALQRPILHLARSAMRSFSPPWPLGGHPTGIRQVLLPAPKKPNLDSSGTDSHG